jgi:hypothetical protein
MGVHLVDLDRETIEFEGKGMGRDDLARAIRQLLDSGNYAIGRHSAALEVLNKALADARSVTFRLPPDLDESLKKAAARVGRSPGALLCDAATQYLSASAPAIAAVAALRSAEVVAVPPVVPRPPPAAEAPESADATAPRPSATKQEGLPPDVERRWFGG